MSGLTRSSALALLLALGPVGAGAAPSETQQLLECMRANLPATLRVQDIAVITYGAAGAGRHLRLRLYGLREKNRFNTLLLIVAPPDLAGGAYLLRNGQGGKEFYLYVPALDQVRKITGDATASTPLFGTDISAGDLQQMAQAFTTGSLSLVGAGQVSGRRTRTLLLLPSPGTPSAYTRFQVEVDEQACIPLRIEFYEDERLRKELTAEPASLKQAAGGYWYAAELVMRDLRDGSRTTLKVLNVNTENKPPSRYFDPRTFYRQR